jgi:DNA-directed RNA polymerase specialized sigma24 family protein
MTLTEAHQRYLAQPDTASMSDLLAEVTSYAYTISRKRNVQHDDAEDVAQDTALTVLEQIDQYDPTMSSIKTWTHRKTLDNVSIRRRKAEAHCKDSAGEAAAKSIRRTDHRLPAIRAAAGDNVKLIDLMLVHGDVAEVAEELAITAKAVQRRLERLAQKLTSPGA